MAQNTVNYANNPTGPELLDDYLAKEQENILSSNSGIQRPSYAVAGTVWIDTSTTPWTWKLYDGSSDITIGTFNISTHASNFIHNNGNETISGTKTFSETSSGANLVQSTSGTASGTWVDFVQQINGARRGTMRTTYNSDGSYQVTFGCNGPNAEAATGVTVKRTTSTTTVTVPTPATSTNNTEVATTAFVKAQGYTTTDTKNTAGSTDTSSKIYLVGATSQAANPQTYSHDTVFVNTSGQLVSATPSVSTNSTVVATTAYVNTKFKKVSTLPASPDSNTFYFIPE